MDRTSSGCYVVDQDYNIVNINATAKALYPQLEPGVKCYQCLMKLDHPCGMCPVANGVTGPQTYIDPIRHIAETVDAVELPVAGHGICHALIFSTVGSEASFASSLPGSAEELKDLSLVRALTIDYCDVFSLCLEDGTVTTYRQNCRLVGSDSGLRRQNSYVLGMESYIEKYVVPEDQAMMRERNSIRSIRQQLREHESVDIHYHVLLNGAIHYYCRKLVRIGNAEDFTNVVIGITCEDEVVRMRLQHHELAKALSEVEYDALTGLFTREAFYLHGKQLFASYPDRDFDFCILKIENLGLIINRYGSGAGDQLQELIGSLLRNYSSDTNCIAYFGDGVFVSLTENDAPQLRRKNIREFQSAIMRSSALRDISPKWSIYMNVPRDISLEEIYEKTSYALSTIRTNMHEDYVEFDRAMLERMEWEESMINHFEELLQDGQFIAWYQPKYSAHTGRIIGAEALVRWVQPSGEVVQPFRFIPVLEVSGKIAQLDLYMFRLVCRLQQKLLQQGAAIVPISVNLSRASVYSGDVAATYSRIAAEMGIPPEMIPIEITETAAIENDAIRRLSESLTGKCFSLHMDDFGSGYSSLAGLHSIPFSCIKFDKSLIDMIGTPHGESLLRHTMAYALETGKSVIAEGVETEAQYDFLKALGCDVIQGYYFSKPVEEAEFLRLLREDRQQA